MYKLKTKNFHSLQIINTNTNETYGNFSRFEERQLLLIINLLNHKDELLTPIIDICDKYRIPLQDLPGVLDEYICNDNDGYFGYSKCEDCRKYDICHDDHVGCDKFTSKYSK